MAVARGDRASDQHHTAPTDHRHGRHGQRRHLGPGSTRSRFFAGQATGAAAALALSASTWRWDIGRQGGGLAGSGLLGGAARPIPAYAGGSRWLPASRRAGRRGAQVPCSRAIRHSSSEWAAFGARSGAGIRSRGRGVRRSYPGRRQHRLQARGCAPRDARL